MEDVIRLFRERLLESFSDWLEKNREAIGEKWYERLQKETWRECSTPIEIMGTALWMFNMIAGFGVLAGVGPDKVSIHEINPRLDEQSTRRLLLIIQACMNLQYLPRDIAAQPIPIISPKKFSLKLFTQQAHE
jgi:hypothetical protein